MGHFQVTHLGASDSRNGSRPPLSWVLLRQVLPSSPRKMGIPPSTDPAIHARAPYFNWSRHITTSLRPSGRTGSRKPTASGEASQIPWSLATSIVPHRNVGSTLSPACKQALRRRWADLIRQVYEVDPLTCLHCGAQMKILAFITRSMTKSSLTHWSSWLECSSKSPSPTGLSSISTAPTPTACDQPAEEVASLHKLSWKRGLPLPHAL